MNEAHRQLEKAGLLNYLAWIEADEDSIEAWAAAALIPDLRKHPSFVETPWWWLHRTLGKHLTDFRGLRGAFGNGSLQIVVDKKTGRCYADVDGFAPVDVYGSVMHMAEVIRNRVRRHNAEHSGTA